ncbi:MAG: hypothetical protein ACRBCS_02295 [Cellvibrionaceae bacterium]
MEFSVIVETSANKMSATEDAVAELERYLLSAKISPKVLENIEPGKPHVLKKEMSYEEAVNLSDRLIDFGLESEIHPPTKPESKLKTKKTNVLSEAAPKTTITMNNQTNKSRHLKTTKAESNPSSADIKKHQPLKSHSETPAPNLKPINSVKTNKTKDKAKTTFSTPSLKEQAAQIKSLFKIPKQGTLGIEITGNDKVQAYLTTFLSLALPFLYILGVSALAVAGIYSAVIFYSLISPISIVLWMLSVALISIPLIALSGLLITPFFIKGKPKLKSHALIAKDEPRFFMLTAAICKIIGVQPPASIIINYGGEFQGNLNAKDKKPNKDEDNKTSLTVCMSLLNTLSIRQYCCLLARELGKLNHEEVSRPISISLKQLQHSKNWKDKPNTSSNALTQAASKLSNDKLINLFSSITSLVETTEYIHSTYFNFAYHSILKRLTTDSLSTRYQNNVLGSEPSTPLFDLNTKLEHIAASRHEAIEMMVRDNENLRYAENLTELIDHIEEKNNSNQQYKVIDDSLIPKDNRLKKLLANTKKHSLDLTKDFYLKNEIDLEKSQLLSIENLLKKESRDAKIEKIASEYFGKWHHGLQVWKLPKEAVLASIDKNHIVIALNNCIKKLRYLSPDRTALIEKYYRQLKQLTEIRAAKKIRSTGAEYKLTSIADNITNLDNEINSREAQLHDINTELTQQNSAMGERMALGLLLDKDHKEMTSKLYSALSVISDCSTNLNNIAADCEELQTLINNSPKKLNQHFNLQLKKVKDRIDDNFKILSRKLKKCPYDFIDQRNPFLYGLLNEKLIKADSANENKRTLQKGKIGLTVTATSYKLISDLAANYATRMERLYKIESIRKL